MTINIPSLGMSKSFLPKVFGLIGIVATCFSFSYHGNLHQIAGMFAYDFWSMIAIAANSAALFWVREDGKSSEQVGAGIISKDVNADVLAQIEELKKKLEVKP